MAERNQTDKNETTNFGIGFTYSPLLGFGFNANLATTSAQSSITERTIQQPAITSERRYAIEDAPRRHERRYDIEDAPPRRERRYAIEDAPRRHERRYDIEDAPRRHERRYDIEDAPRRPNNSRSPIIDFYKNKIVSGPQGYYIETILKDWIGNYEQLDDFFHYIQWLFPNRKPGKNPDAPLLTDEDVEEICSSGILKEHALQAFEIMLDYFGMKLLTDSQTFDLADNHVERLKLIISPGKLMVITRILHFLKEINEDQLIIAWLKFFADLIKQKKIDDCVKDSFNKFWIKTLNDSDKQKIQNYIKSINKN